MTKTAKQTAALTKLAGLQGGTPSALRTAESVVARFQRIVAGEVAAGSKATQAQNGTKVPHSAPAKKGHDSR